MPSIWFQVGKGSHSVRHKNGKYIPFRLRNYVYWYKFLQHAEQSPDYQVDWKKYKGWGGANVILEQKFQTWWDERWETLFGLDNIKDKQKFPFTSTRIQTEGIRLSLLCYEKRNAPVWNKRGNALSIAKAVYEYELGISGEKKPRYSIAEFSASNLNPEGKWMDSRTGEEYDVDRQILQSYISRYLRRARKTLKNVSQGQFP